MFTVSASSRKPPLSPEDASRIGSGLQGGAPDGQPFQPGAPQQQQAAKGGAGEKILVSSRPACPTKTPLTEDKKRLAQSKQELKTFIRACLQASDLHARSNVDRAGRDAPWRRQDAVQSLLAQEKTDENFHVRPCCVSTFESTSLTGPKAVALS